MPISQSAKKALRVSKRKTSVNRHRKALLKEALKNVDVKTVNTAISLVDKAAKWGIVHPHRAARIKSRLAKEVGSTPKETAAAAPKKAPVAAKAKKTTKKSAK